MPYVVGKTATLRHGQFIPGGKPFEVSLAELPELQASGFKEVESENCLRPNFPGINITPEKETERISEISRDENPDSKFIFEDPDKKFLSGALSDSGTLMGGASKKAKASSKVSSRKVKSNGQLEK